MSLVDRLKRQIAIEGPMTVAAFMAACLHDPHEGYYAAHPQLGPDGDFITAPMVSQIFGELIGLWFVETWERLGRPCPVQLVEVGPGRGELIIDALRAAATSPEFLAAIELWLVEPSGPLRSLQAENLTPERLKGLQPNWVQAVSDLPADRPILLIANEVLDCLPARQFIRIQTGWAERRIGLSEDGELVFGFAPIPAGFTPPDLNAPLGAVFEMSSAQEAFGEALGERITQTGGAALLIDYGRDAQGFGDTLQALRRHQKVAPLASPGEADLTVHADFPSVAQAAQRAGAGASRIISQGAFLCALGAPLRAEALKAAARARGRPDLAETIDRQLARLIDDDQMGRLFKVLCIHQPGLTTPGFEAAT